MEIREFLDKYNYAPYDTIEVAEIIISNKVNAEKAELAKQYIDAKDAFEDWLEDIGYEFG